MTTFEDVNRIEGDEVIELLRMLKTLPEENAVTLLAEKLEEKLIDGYDCGYINRGHDDSKNS